MSVLYAKRNNGLNIQLVTYQSDRMNRTVNLYSIIKTNNNKSLVEYTHSWDLIT